ncbi:MAG: tRNA preQ1(34) S-adenosylmethionine ribosyltransferase-isomerase QueA [Bacteroidales bacterium]|nr:tRNA preQ1(34) S-adenosylmethionine ribosyltransferase-isomerase QueA [Bacteroidales bacterium]MDI9592493.1 tRNA preQ1(34) S-adenosylmethionine ribosyltransferase-isomerase QueA [Bacteroidota bacterium]
MKLSQFKYHLPSELIASQPPENRDQCRMMILDRKTKSIEHKNFSDILDYYDDGDVFVLNNTKVFPAKLIGIKEKTGARIEVFLLRELNIETRLWDVLVDPARKIRIGNKLYFGEQDELVAEVIDNTISRGRILRFLYDGPYPEFRRMLQAMGKTPLPKAINREVKPEDEVWYQTIFAKHEGAVVAPTAGLHFTRELMKRFEIKGINFAELTLHAGLGNFRQIEVEDLSKHKMDSEDMNVDEKCVEIVNKAKDDKKQICSVGTTTIKAIESALTISGHLKPYSGWTNKFIYPPYDFKLATSMVTNFHLPMSNMLILTAAFADYNFLMKAYKEAVQKKYKFFSYGDAMLIL